MSETYLTTGQVAKMHKVTRGRVVQWIHAKSDPLLAEKFSHVWMIKQSNAKNYKRKPITGRPKKEQ